MGEREPFFPAGEAEALAAWRALPAFYLGATISGRPAPTATWVRIASDGERLHALFLSPDAPGSGAGEGVAVLVDPAGDLESYYEIGLSADGTLRQAVLRRNRSGYKRDPRWRGPGVQGDVRSLGSAGWSASLVIPFRDLADTAPDASWFVNAQRSHADGTRATLERLPGFLPMIFGAGDLH